MDERTPWKEIVHENENVLLIRDALKDGGIRVQRNCSSPINKKPQNFKTTHGKKSSIT